MSYNYIIGAGHTPSGTLGCGAVSKIDESKCTREIAPLIVSGLNSNGKTAKYVVVNTGNSSNLADCYSRINQANNEGCDLYVEIHLNAGGGTGVEVLVPSNASSSTKTIAEKICNKISQDFSYPNRGVKTRSLVIFSNAKVPAILIECGFVDSKDADLYDPIKYANSIVNVLSGSDLNVDNLEEAANSGSVPSSEWKQGWNKDQKGWFYVLDATKKTYYKKSDGWQKIKGYWYIFDDIGYALQNRWYQDTDKTWYYLDDQCQMVASSWILESDTDTWYYVNSSGKMIFNEWLIYKDNKYYLKQNGEMARDEILDINNTKYTFDDTGKLKQQNSSK